MELGFAERLKELREKNKMTQEGVAQYLNVSRSTVAGYETKQRQPSYEKILALARLFHVSVDYLLSGDSNFDITISPRDSKTPSDLKRLASIYMHLAPDSQKDLLKIAHLLELGDKEQAHR